MVIDVRQLTNSCYLVTKHRYAADFYCDCGWTLAALVSRLGFLVLHRLAAVVVEVAHVVLAHLHPLVSVANIPQAGQPGLPSLWSTEGDILDLQRLVDKLGVWGWMSLAEFMVRVFGALL